MRADTTETQDRSELLHAIYGCILQPAGWPSALTQLASTLNCHVAALSVLDRRPEQPTLRGWYLSEGVSEQWSRRHTENNYAADAIPFFEFALSQPDFDWDHPIVLSKLVPPEEQLKMRVIREWAHPQGFCDVMSIVVLEAPECIVTVDLIRHETQGTATDSEISGLRALAPHLRRAASIASLLDLQAVEVNALTSAVETMTTGMLFLDPALSVVHSNAAARAICEQGNWLQISAGRLQVTDAGAADALHRAARTIATQDQGIAIQFPAPRPRSAIGLGYLLPLKFMLPRPQVAPTAVMVLFITNLTTDPEAGIHLFATAFNLSGAEARLLQQLATGAPLTEIAATLDIEMSTVRTHLARIFTKTGTKRQGELIALMARLALPLANPSG